MKAAIVKKWIKALRSGKYEQGKGSLQRYGKYCCIGVLADVCGSRWTAEDAEGKRGLRSGRGDINVGALPDNLGLKLGLPSEAEMKLMRMNDGTDGPSKSFKRIATYIEKNYAKWGKRPKVSSKSTKVPG